MLLMQDRVGCSNMSAANVLHAYTSLIKQMHDTQKFANKIIWYGGTTCQHIIWQMYNLL